jgi:uncharacterized protein (TIGR03118 family)
MHPQVLHKHSRKTIVVLAIAIVFLAIALGFPFKQTDRTVRAQEPIAPVIRPDVPNIPPGSAYRQTNFISDVPGLAPGLDPLLVNPWGIGFRGTSPFWISNNGTSTASLYRGDVGGSPLVKNPGLSFITITGGLPTGVVGNATTDFAVTPCSVASCPAAFIFSSITGNIVGWNPSVTGNPTTGVIAASHPGHVYTGLAIGSNSGGNRLYAADFNSGTIDVYDGTYALTTTTGGFADPTIPTTPGNTYHPFNIQNIGGLLYVMYAKVGTDGKDEEGVGNGFVRRFNTDGVRDLTFGINNGPLNSPWGVAIAPSTFGIFGSALLIGNFGEGNPSIHAFNPTTGAFLGTIQNENGDGIEIDELWALQFGNGGNGGDVNTLYFTSGIGEEEHGLFGKLNPTTATATSLIQFATDDFAIGEGSGHIDITVIRAGDSSGTATVNFNTFDKSQPDHASQKSDYELAAGTLTFGPGETAKTFRILIVNDLFDENDETLDLYLSNPTGAGVGLGTPNHAQLRILDNDTGAPATNPVDDPTFFVRQHFLDFYNREPDASAAGLISQITACGANPACVNTKRVAVSTSFFNSPEYQGVGSQIVRTHKAAFGGNASGSPTDVLYGDFEIGIQALLQGVTIGAAGDPQLETNKQAYYNAFVNRPDFKSKYDTLTNAQYVDAILANAGIGTSDFTVNLTNSQEVPPTNPRTATGTLRLRSYGTARFQFNVGDTAMTMTATVNNIDINGTQTADTNDNLVAAHIHAGPAVMPGVNGSVVWGFFGSPFNDNNPDDHVVTPFSAPAVGGTFTDKWDAPEGNGTTLTAQLANIRAGHAYINFHTTQFGGGEIRGNFPATQAFRDNLVNALNATTLTRAQVLRQVAEDPFYTQREAPRDMIALGFFGYLRRDADVATFNLYLNTLNNQGGDINRSNIVRIFMTSSEYRQRFGPDGFFVTNTAPLASTDTATTNSITPVSIDVLANDIDPDGDFLLINSVTPGTGGTPTISADNRSILFTPAPGFAGSASFQYTVTDNGTNNLATSPFFNPMFATATVTVTVTSAGTFQLSNSTYSVAEGAGKLTVTVNRSGDSNVPVSVDYATSDTNGLTPCATVGGGAAGARCDYESAFGTLKFAAGEVSKTFDVFITDDTYVEGPETFTITLSNPVGTNFTLGTPSTATVTITDNDSSPGAPNPINDTTFFLTQHYRDFLNRDPDPGGLAGWINVLNTCPAGNTSCDRIAVSLAFFLSDEFQNRGYFIYRFYAASLGRKPTYTEFMMDLSRLSGFLTPAQLEANKVVFVDDFMNRPEFKTKYDPITDPAAYVKALEQTAGVTLANEAALISGLQMATETRATVLRKVAESPEVTSKFLNEAFVVEAYFGYLRRDPDALFSTWIGILNSTGDRRNIVNGFVNSVEYRQRFGPA